eukprot:2872178-Prymnesium_polylepis.2
MRATFCSDFCRKPGRRGRRRQKTSAHASHRGAPRLNESTPARYRLSRDRHRRQLQLHARRRRSRLGWLQLYDECDADVYRVRFFAELQQLDQRAA